MLKTATVALALTATVATSGCATRRENAALAGGAGATVGALTH